MRPHTPHRSPPRTAIEQRAEIEEGPGDVDIGEIDVPVLMRNERLLIIRLIPTLGLGLRLTRLRPFCGLNQASQETSLPVRRFAN